MKISAISQNPTDEDLRRSMFMRFSNSFMSAPEGSNPVEQANEVKKTARMGIENIQELTVFPKQVIDGKTIITA